MNRKISVDRLLFFAKCDVNRKIKFTIIQLLSIDSLVDWKCTIAQKHDLNFKNSLNDMGWMLKVRYIKPISVLEYKVIGYWVFTI